MSARLTLVALFVLLPAAAALAQPARPVYQPPVEELPSPEELPAPAIEGPATDEAEQEFVGEPPALLGVHVVPLTRELLQFYGPELRSGVVIDSIGQGTPADIYRLPIGGAIVAVDNIQITEPAELAAVIGMYAPGDFISIVYHDGRQFAERRVRLAPRANLAAWQVPPGVAPREDPPLVLRPSDATEGELLPELPPPLAEEEAILTDADIDLILSHIQELRRRSQEIEAEIDSLEAILQSQER